MKLKVKRLHKDATLPRRGTEWSAGLDLHALEEYVVLPGQTAKLPTGIALEIPMGFYGQVRSRSSAFMRGLFCVGTIDSDYRGEVFVMATNTSAVPKYVEKGTSIAQLMLHAVLDIDVLEAEELSETDRGAGGFGSTGKTGAGHG